MLEEIEIEMHKKYKLDAKIKTQFCLQNAELFE